MAAYRALVYETPGFTDYFFSATPIREIAELNIGSRPASRKASRAIEDLRAIPWSFSWGQCRVALPGWYGFGLGIEAFLGSGSERARARAAARMATQWPFFATLISNLDMVIAKSDMAIAARYAEPAEDTKAGRQDLRAHRGRVGAHHAALTLITGEPTASRQSVAGALDRAPLPVPRPAQPPAGRADAPLPREPQERPGLERVQRGIHISIKRPCGGLRNTGSERRTAGSSAARSRGAPCGL
jgi:phosphoenolpyruvate carboxylase